jgi:hypothetical protein
MPDKPFSDETFAELIWLLHDARYEIREGIRSMNPHNVCLEEDITPRVKRPTADTSLDNLETHTATSDEESS